jgi:hypothetical protein
MERKMATAVQRPSQSTHIFDTPKVDQIKYAELNSKALSEGVSPVYLQGKLYKITDKSGMEPRIACAVSLLNDLEFEPESSLQALKEEHRIGAIHVEDGEIKSLTLAEDQIQILRENGVNEIAFKVDNTVLIIKEKVILRKYSSGEEYDQFFALISGKLPDGNS